MAQPFFPGIEQIMTILLGEMPNGLYAQDRADSVNTTLRSYSSSEIRAHAQVFATMYANLQDIYENKFITTLNPDGISQWEKDLFSTSVDASIPFPQRQANVLAKYRAQGGLSYPYITQIVGSILNPQGIPFEIVTYNCANNAGDGAWILDVSQLDVSTYLAFMDPLVGAAQDHNYVLDCGAILNLVGTTTVTSTTVSGFVSTSGIEVGAGIVGVGIPLNATVVSVTDIHNIVISAAATASHALEAIQIQNYIAAGLTLDELTSIQMTAYTYEVRIYGNASAATIATLDQLLTSNEKGGVTHVITNNFPQPPDGTLVDMGTFTADTLIDNIDFGKFKWLAATYDIWDFGSF